ncbi:MAG: septum formation initiator family protein [Acutalibacteraceae bacterium]
MTKLMADKINLTSNPEILKEVNLEPTKLEKSKKNKKRNIVLYVVLSLFTVYAIVTLVNQQLQINQAKDTLNDLQSKIDIVELNNEEIKKVYNSDEKESAEYIEKIAREQFGYAKEGERIFINIAG